MLAVVDNITSVHVEEGIGPPAEMLASLEQKDIRSGLAEIDGRSKARESSPDYYDSFAQPNPPWHLRAVGGILRDARVPACEPVGRMRSRQNPMDC